MSSLAISVRNLSKRYRLGLKEEMPDSFAKVVGSWVASPLANYRRLRRLSHFDDDTPGASGQPSDILYALRDFSMEVRKGEVVGIIGRNGAGKSTLLKILSRIVEPTSGRVEIYGRVASLLEVGTGFHPELTGRENIYLNGTILGMRKHEIDHKIDEIVDFSGIEKFLDTQVKRYSSGMYVRLAFAVAAHLEPEILILDEVLAVGDGEFQKKCLSKMNDVAHAGRTILFVSHNLVAVQSLCTRAILLSEGRVLDEGPTASVVSGYLRVAHGRDETVEWETPEKAPGTDALRVKRVQILPETPDADGLLTMQTPLRVQTDFWVFKSDVQLHLAYHLLNDQGIVVLTTGSPPARRDPGIYRVWFTLPANLLNSGGYTLRLLIVQNESRVIYQNDSLASFTVADTAVRDRAYMGREPGVVQPALCWRTETLEG